MAVIAVVVIVVIAGVAVGLMMSSSSTKSSITTTPITTVAPSSTSTTSTSISTTTTIPLTTSTSTSSTSSSSSTTTAAAPSIEILNGTSNSNGQYLANATGWTLYIFTNDTQNSGNSSCYGACATFWPAFHGNASSLVLPAGLNASSFGTITRTDGTTQITYDGWPLYFYLGDKAAGQTNGEGKDGTWFVVNFPSLKIPAKTTSPTSSATTTSTSSTTTVIVSSS